MKHSPPIPLTAQIVCLTYNQAAYVTQALDSFVAQKTDFPWEVIIADDCSTDGTAEIIAAYQQQFPEIIKPLFQSSNVGVTANLLDALSRVTAEYVALCEGDDYWIDADKLQKQVDALRAHKECAICFHPISILDENGLQPDKIFPDPEFRFHKTRLNIGDLMKRNFMQTNAVVYRWRFKGHEIRRDFPENILPCDWFLHLLHAETGDILFLDDVMGVYRKWSGGIWSGAWESESWFCKYGIPHLRFFHAMHARFPQCAWYSKLLRLDLTERILQAAQQAHRPDVAQALRDEFPASVAMLPRYAALLWLKRFAHKIAGLPFAQMMRKQRN